jgi:hypothetical protein
MCPFIDRAQQLGGPLGRVIRPEPVMTATSICPDVLVGHVLFEI